MLRSLVHQNQHVLVGEAVSVAKEKKIFTNGGCGGGPCSDMQHTDRGLQGASHCTHAGGGKGEEAHLHRVLMAHGSHWRKETGP